MQIVQNKLNVMLLSMRTPNAKLVRELKEGDMTEEDLLRAQGLGRYY